ncbi:hypothetical protein HZH68_005753 [Vespula germanica]|uniref:Uncharacterized protein n=1 Tax=Vespula germanica TaxID=30212 RepID=A0A834NFT1_VESGE|nr:hypothetical protein HZH68_005753 [Vespula germanica]
MRDSFEVRSVLRIKSHRRIAHSARRIEASSGSSSTNGNSTGNNASGGDGDGDGSAGGGGVVMVPRSPPCFMARRHRMPGS